MTVFDPSHRKVALSADGLSSPLFGPEGEAVAMANDGSIVILKVTLPSS